MRVLTRMGWDAASVRRASSHQAARVRHCCNKSGGMSPAAAWSRGTYSQVGCRPRGGETDWRGMPGSLRRYACVVPDRDGRPLHLTIWDMHEVDTCRAANCGNPMAAQEGNTCRRPGFRCIVGRERAEGVVTDSFAHRRFAGYALRQRHTLIGGGTASATRHHLVPTNWWARSRGNVHGGRGDTTDHRDRWLARSTAPGSRGACGAGGRWGRGREAGPPEQPLAGAPNRRSNIHPQHWLGWGASGRRPGAGVLVGSPN